MMAVHGKMNCCGVTGKVVRHRSGKMGKQCLVGVGCNPNVGYLQGKIGGVMVFRCKRSSSARVDDVEKRDVAVHAGNDGSNFDLSMYYEAEISEYVAFV